MADTTFVDGLVTTANRIVAAWLNTINNVVYRGASPNYATTGGSANAQTLTLPAGSLYTTNTAGDTFTFKAGFTNTGATTLAVNASGGTNAACAVNGYAGALSAGAIVAGKIYTVTFNTGSIWSLSGQTGVGTMTANGALMTTAKLLGRTTASTGAVEEITVGSGLGLSAGTLSSNPSTSPEPRLLQNVGLSVTMAGNAFTVALLDAANNITPTATTPAILGFRSATITSGAASTVSVVASNTVVVSSGSTLGTVSTQASRIWIGAILQAGTVELAVYNALNGTNIAPINEGALISTTAEGGAGAADSAGVWYSTTARSNVPVTIVGYFESTQATAGTWVTAASAVVVNPALRPGNVLQSVINQTGAVVTGAVTVPIDDTIPQKTEGNEMLTQAITPKFAGNLLYVHHHGCYACAAAQDGAVFLLQDTTADALKTSGLTVGNVGWKFTVVLDHTMVAGTTSATTFKINAGFSGAAVTLNGMAGSRLWGGSAEANLQVTEIFA